MMECIDNGQEGCPCVLAESGDCLVCSRVPGGRGTCDNCNWQGTCVYMLYEQNGCRVIQERQNRELPIDRIRSYGPNLKVFVLEADKGYCQKAQRPGAFVFVKSADDQDWFGAPISVLKAEPDRNRLHLAVCACGPKTSRILQRTENLHVRGIYYNALAGQNSLLMDPEETFVFAKGVALAPLRNYLDSGKSSRRLLQNLRAIVDIEKVGMDFFLDYFGDLPVGAVQIRDFAREGLCAIEEQRHLQEQCLARSRVNVLALTSPYYVQRVREIVGKDKGILRPTEGNMCCGEGICGACTQTNAQGQIIRNCKVRKAK